jgi:hypothetical protein
MAVHPDFATRALSSDEIAEISAQIRTGNLLKNFMEYMQLVTELMQSDTKLAEAPAKNIRALHYSVSSDLLKVLPR